MSKEKIPKTKEECASIDPSAVNNGETPQTEEDKQNENIKDSHPPKKKIGCFTIFCICALILFSHYFITPMAKLYMRQRMNRQIETSGVYGAGLDRAEPIMDKIKEEPPSSLGMFGQLDKVSYGIGTIIMEFNKTDYENSPPYTKEFVMAKIYSMPNSLKKVMEEIVEEDFSLSIVIYSETTKSTEAITLSPYEIGQALNR